ncbi:MAG: hypothetical protein J5940_05855, partial [Clostridia bacterium]|nr:hypothetical protein [Clostridia bacterium]
MSLLCVSALVFTAFAASSCGESAPEKAIIGYFEALHNLDTEKLIRYSADGSTGKIDFSSVGDKADLVKRLLYVSFSVVDDGIDESSAKGADETVARTSITYIDCGSLFGR